MQQISDILMLTEIIRIMGHGLIQFIQHVRHHPGINGKHGVVQAEIILEILVILKGNLHLS